MNATPRDHEQAQALTGWLLGLSAMVIFGMTLPAVRIALQGFDPWFLGFCRASIAAAAGGALLLVLRQPAPRRGDIRSLILSALGVVLGFPLLMNWAMQSVPASHGGVVLGLLPLATAIAAVIWNRERPSLAFWASGFVGSALVALFALLDSASLDVQIGDAVLLLAIALCAMGYAAGAEAAKRLGGWQTISWALLIALPVTLPGTLLTWGWNATPSAPAWAALLYLGLFSQFLLLLTSFNSFRAWPCYQSDQRGWRLWSDRPVGA